jgi:hypothetical protein
VALSLGFVCSGPLVLAVEAALRMGPNAGWLQILALYEFVAVVCACGLAAALVAQWRIWQLEQPARRSISEAGGAAEPLLADGCNYAEQGQGSRLMGTFTGSRSTPSSPGRQGLPAGNGLAYAALQSASFAVLDDPSALDVPASEGPGADGHAPAWGRSSSIVRKEAVYWNVLQRAWPAAASLAIGVGTSMLLFPLFP